MVTDDDREIIRLRKEKRKLISLRKLQELSNVCNQIGELLSRQGKYEAALQEHREEEEVCLELNDLLGVAIANRKIGECHSELGNYSQAIRHQHKHLEIAIDLKNVVEEQRAYATIGRTHLFRAEVPVDKRGRAATDPVASEALKSSEEAFLKSLDLCSRIQSLVDAKELAQMQGRLFLNLGLVHDQRGDLDGCPRFIRKAIVIFKDNRLADDLLRCHHSLCAFYKRHGDLEAALEHCREAFDVVTKETDAVTECEIRILNAQILLLSSDFYGAKKVLNKKARKRIASLLPESAILDEAFRLWKTAAKLCAAEERLLNSQSDDVDTNRITHEKMGDLCCRVDNYEKALHHYHRSLNLTRLMGLGDERLAPLYLSLAQTYSDTGQYERAIEYYRLELECRSDNPKEKCKTLMNIAVCEESAGKDKATVEHTYHEALECARAAEDSRLEMRCLTALAALRSTSGETDIDTNGEMPLANDERGPCESTEEEEEEEERQSSDDSSVPSDESSTDDEAGERPRPNDTSAQRKAFRLRRNEKGETPLHRACIDGDLNRVQRLLDQGHAVNMRDYSGWLPLHEAANHDHADIVETLLDHGAWIDDRGGEHCDGITPLHDAASNGNLSVVRLLLARGASVLAKTAKGDSVLACLRKWQRRAEGDTDGEIIRDSERLMEELREAAEKAADALRAVGRPRPVIDDGADVEEESASGCGGDYDSNEALMREDGDVDVAVVDAEVHDWLVNDVRQPPAKQSRKRRRSVTRRSTVSEHRRPTREKRSRVEDTNAHGRRTSTDDGADSSESRTEDFDIHDDDGDERRWSSPLTTHEPLEVVVEANDRTVGPKVLDHVVSSMLRIKVKVLDKLLLVPVPASESVGRLAHETAERYCALHGLRPVLSLSTKDGALLAVADQVNQVISQEDEVVGTVESWDLPPLEGRYNEACFTLGEVPCKNVADILARDTAAVHLSNVRLTVAQIRPICRALQCRHSLRELSLSANRFGDDGLQHLAQALVNLPGLEVLDLSCNDLSDRGILRLTVGAKDGILQRLRTLKLGYNPLIDGSSCPNLCSLIVNCPLLEELHLQFCCVGEHEWFDDDLLHALSRTEHLCRLNLGFNRLPPSSRPLPSWFVASLRRLRRLDLRGVATSSATARILCQALVALFDVDDPHTIRLRELDLALCSLDTECLASLSDVFVRTRAARLMFLDLTSNDGLSSTPSSVSMTNVMADEIRLS